jgi:hypothetical protein
MANEGALPLKGLTRQVEIHQYALNFVILLCIKPHLHDQILFDKFYLIKCI